MTEIQGKSILVRVSARFELSGVDCISMEDPGYDHLTLIIIKNILGELSDL